MLRFELEITPCDSEHDIDSFSPGHITIMGRKGSSTSKGKQPDQAIMIFLSIVELLDGLRRFMLAKDVSDYRFIAVDSSFQFSVTKLGDDCIRLTSEQEIIDEVQTTEMIKAVWKGISAFLSDYGTSIKPDDPGADDLRSAVDSFIEAFGSIIESA